MNQRISKPRRLLAVLLALAMMLSILPTAVFAASPVYTRITDPAQFTSGQYLLVAEHGYAPGALDGTWLSAVQMPDGDTITEPDASAVWTLAVTGSEVTLTDANGVQVAPKGGEENGIKAGDYSWAWKFENGGFSFCGQDGDPVTLASNKGSQNKFRAYKNTTVSGNPAGYPSVFALYRLEEGGDPGQTVAAPQADPQAGEVEKGTAITLTTATAGASIYYTLDGSDPTDTAAAELYSPDNRPVIEAACTLKAVAVLDGSFSAVQQLQYTVKEQEPPAPIADGDKVVIYAPAYGKALSSTYNGFYNNGVDVKEESGQLTGYTDAEIWTVIDNGDGSFSFAAPDGRKIGMGDSFSSMPLGEKNDRWTLEDAGDGKYYVKNTVRSAYMEWYDAKNNWSAYGTIAAGSEGMFALKFAKVEEAPPAGPIADGDKVVIYAPAYGKALSSTYNGFYNNGVDVKEESGQLTGYTDAEIWTVIDNGDGSFSFAAPDGRKIGMGDSFSSMPLGEKNDRWTLEDAGDGKYYVKNTVRGAYMEWFDKNNNWSAYGTIAAGSEGMFALKFAKAEDVEEPEEPTGDALEVQASPKSGASVTAGDTVTLKAGQDAEIYFTMAAGEEPADPDVINPDQKYTSPIPIDATPEKDKPITIKAVAYVPASEEAEAQTGKVYTFVYKAPMEIGDYQLYFGQLHAHTALSDGTGTVQQAFDHAADVPNLDFLAVTDHSNWFEGRDGLPGSGTTHMGDADAEKNNAAWGEGRQAARDITAREDGTFVGLYGFEMTWSGGAPGHINTFNSKGFENRNAAPYKKGDNYEVLQAYFDTLNENPETISQFNHPGDTFGDFMDFALYDPITDNQMTLVEVGNGEGPIGGSGYFPSYAYYTRALDKGWHVAPTNNQDNHKGNWGDSNTARSVVLAEDLTEEGIYDAMKNYRVYATEDNDLSILYTLNGNAMGSILGDQDSIHIEAAISDPTDTAGTTRVEVIVNGGQVLAEDSFTGGSATVTFDGLSASYGYYYLRITQADKNIAVTAPVWVGESINAGVSGTKSDVLMPIRGDQVNLSSQVFNNTGSDMTVQSLTYTIEGQQEPFHTADLSQIGTNGVVAPRTSVGYSFPYSADTAGGFNINVQMQVEIDGEQYTFTDVLKLSVSDPSVATRILVDGTHYNDYVNGYYAGNMTNFINMGTAQNIQVRIAQPGETITPELLEDVSLFVISAPLKYTSDYTGDAKVSAFELDFIQMVADYVNGGGTVVVCALADYQDGQLPYTSYQQANALLEGIGAKVRVNDDELLDQESNGGQPYRLYFDRFNTESEDPAVQQILAGVVESGLTYSSYSGCSVNVSAGGEPIVFGHDSTYSINSKSPAQGHDKPVLSYSDPYDPSTAVVPKGEVVAMATEQVGEGRVYVSGTVFCSNFEVAAEDADSYANAIMLRNLMTMVKREPVISTILEARAGQPGEVFTVQGTVANGTAESGNAFFDTIYIQDEEGNGINVFPINDNTIRRGDRVQVTGSVSEYIGDKQLSAISVTTLEGTAPVVITDVSTKQANDYAANFGKLVRVEGKVQKVELAGGKVETILLQDDSGESCRVFIDGYIGYSDDTSPALEEFVKEGAAVSAVGFVSHDAVGNRLRVRDRSEIREGTAEPTVQFTVKVSVSGGSWNGPALATAGKDYTGTLTAASGYALPSSVTVTVAGKTLAKDAYTYDPATGKLTLPAAAVNGEITISVTCVQTPSPDQPGTGGGSSSTGGNAGALPATGDTAPVTAVVLLGMLALAGASVLVRRRIRRR